MHNKWTSQIAAMPVGHKRQPMNDRTNTNTAHDQLQPPYDQDHKQQQLEAIVDSVNGVIWSVDYATQQVCYLSAAVETISGRPAKDFFQNPSLWVDVVHPEDKQRVLQEHQVLIEQGHHDLEYRIVHADNSIRWVHTRAQVVYDVQHTPVRINGISTDITNHITLPASTETELQASQRRLKAIFEQADIGIGLIDQHGHYIECNHHWAALLQYHPTELVGLRYLDSIHADERDLVARHMRDLAAGTIDRYQLECRCIRKDGSLFWASFLVTRLQHAANQPEATLHIMTDITGHKQVQQAERAALDLTQARASELEHLKLVAETLNQAITPYDALQSGLETVVTLIDAHAGWLWMVSDQGATHVAAAVNPPPSLASSPEAGGATTLCRCLQRLLGDELIEPGYLLPCNRLHEQHYLSGNLTQHASIPIRAGGKPIGILNLILPTERSLTMADMRLFRSIRDQFGVAMERARLFAQTSEALAREQRLNEVTYTISSALDLPTVLQTVVRLAVELVSAEHGDMGLLNADTNKIEFPYSFNLPANVLTARQSLESDQGLFWHVLQTGESLLVEEYSKHPAAAPQMVTVGLYSMIVVPIIESQQFIGALGLYNLTPNRHFSQRDLILAELVARQAGVAIQNARLFEQAHRRAEEAETLRQTSAVVAASLNQEEAISRILEQLAHVVPYDSASVQLLRGSELEIGGGRGFENTQEIIGMRLPINDHTPAKIVCEQLQPHILADAPASYPAFKHSPHHHMRSWLGVPLIVKDKLIGMLALDSIESAHFTPHHARLVTAFAGQVAVALENARLFAEARQMAITDPLTGLYNRRHFFALAAREIERTRRYRSPLSALMLDVDHFKAVNDRYGHAIGDQVLHAVAEWCLANLRSVDIVGRYGGEEFVILLPNTDLTKAWVVAEHLRQQLMETSIDTDSGTLWVTASLGVAATEHNNLIDIDTLLDHADQALLAAKQGGRNCVFVWDVNQISMA